MGKFSLAEVGGFPGLSREVGAGFIAGLSALTNCFAYGALIFSGPLHAFLAEGIAASLITCSACALVIALMSRFRTAIAAPVANTSALIAVLMASLAPAMLALPPQQRLALAYAALFTATAATAVGLLLVGFIRAGKIVRFVPYPVIAGFMGASGWLVVAGAVKMVTDVPVGFTSLVRFAQPREGLLLAILLAWTAALWIITKRVKHPLTLPAALVLASIATDLLFRLLGMSGEEVAARGFLFSVSSASWPEIPALNGEYLLADWSLLLPIMGAIGAVVLIAVLQSLMLATGLEVTTRTEVDLDQESRATGWANLVSAMLGGYVGLIALSATTVNRSAGGTTRIAGVVVSILALVSILGAGAALEFIPRFVLGGALLMQGLRLVQEWAVTTYRTLPLAEWLLVVVMVVITAWLGFIPAEVAGLLAACVLFALNVSRIDVVRAIYGLDARTSSVVRSEEEMLFLAEQGSRVQVMELRGFVFFGSVQALRERVKSIVAERRPMMLIFDFSRVIGIDSSAASAMVRVSRQLGDAGVRQIAVGLSEGAIRATGESAGLDKDTVKLAGIDEALERGEQVLLSTNRGNQIAKSSFSDWLATTLGSAEYAAILQRHLVAAPYKAGDFLCRHGDATDDLYFIEQGRLCATLEMGVSAPTRVRVFGPKTIVGEIAFVLNVPRTASLRVDEEALVWSLDRRAFGELMKAHPDLALALWQHVVRIQAERLSFATRQIAALN